MRVYIRGTGNSGEPVEGEAELPDTMKVGDTFVFSAGGEEHEVEIIGMHKEAGPGRPLTTLIVGPLPEWEQANKAT